MQVLLIGGSRIAERRVIPALARSETVTRLHLASRSGRQLSLVWPRGARNSMGETFADYGEAIDAVPGGSVAYVSLPNSMHFEWAARALERGLHVIVDKPATTNVETAEQLAALAGSRGLCLAEATVWMYHPQIGRALAEFDEAIDVPIRAMASFTFPLLPVSDFRNDPVLGGGAVEDVGPYAVTCGRVLFGSHASEVFARVNSHHPATGVPLSFAILARWSDGRSLVGQFGFGGPYRNSLVVHGERTGLTIDRAFSTPTDMTCLLEVQHGDSRSTISVPPADSFAVFLDEVLGVVERREDPGRFRHTLVEDARAMQLLRQQAGSA